MLNLMQKTSDKSQDQEAKANYFNINAEGLLLREAHDICEELKMMQRVYDQQTHVTEEFRKALANLSTQMHSRESNVHLEIRTSNPPGDFVVEKRIVETKNDTGTVSGKWNHVPMESIGKVNDLLEELGHRKWELQDLERAAKDVSDQVSCRVQMHYFMFFLK